MKPIDAESLEALVELGQMFMIVGFAIIMFGFVLMVCGWILGKIL